MEEKKISKKKNTGVIITISILIMIILGLMIYICCDKKIMINNKQNITEKKTKKEEDKTKEEENKDQPIDKITNKNIGLDPNKCINSNNYNYTLTDYSLSGVNFKLDQTNNTVTLYVNWDSIVQWGISFAGIRGNEYNINNFSGKVVDMYVNGIGQDATGSVALFLLEDGTIEYIPLYKALQNNDIRSYGKVNGVENIIKFYSVSATGKNENSVGGFQTILAQKEDGTFYDLHENLSNNLGI